MSANRVSPPTSGTSTARSIDPSDGSCRQVTSLCQKFSVPASVLVVLQHHHLGEAPLGRHERVHLEVAEVAAEGDVLVGRDVLVAEEQDLVVDEGLLELGEGRVVERLGQVEPVISAPMVGVSGRTSIMASIVPDDLRERTSTGARHRTAAPIRRRGSSSG